VGKSIDFLWFCVLQPDGEYLGTKELPPRKPTLEMISNLIDTAGEMGFSSLLTAAITRISRRRSRPWPAREMRAC
jgi:hypothetical protein